MDSNFHTFHIHGHRWRDPAGAFIDNPAMGPNESVTARFVEDNPGRWLYHCHVFSHQDAGMAGWYVVDPVMPEEKTRFMRILTRVAPLALVAAALLAPAAASAQTYPAPQGARAGLGQAEGAAQDLHGVQGEAPL